MPIYEYRCDACGTVFEALQRIADAPLDTCRDCGGAAKRIISSPAIRFLGSGWYVTDYAKKGEAKRDRKAPAAESKPAGSKDAPAGKTKEPSGGGETRASSPS